MPTSPSSTMNTHSRFSDGPPHAGRCIPCQLPITIAQLGEDGYPVCPMCSSSFVEGSGCNIEEMSQERQRLIKYFQERLPGLVCLAATTVLNSPYAYSYVSFVLVRLRQMKVHLPCSAAEVRVTPRNQPNALPKSFKQALAQLSRYDLEEENPKEKVLNRDSCPICMEDFPEEHLPIPLPKVGASLSSVLDDDGDNYMLDIDDWDRVSAKMEQQKKQPPPTTIPGSGSQDKASGTNNTKNSDDKLDGIVAVMPCKHMFHEESCLKPWLIKDRAHSCPLCRTKLPFGVTEPTQFLGQLILDISSQFIQHVQASGWQADGMADKFTKAYDLVLKSVANREDRRRDGRRVVPLPARARRAQAQVILERTADTSRWVQLEAEPQATSQT